MFASTSTDRRVLEAVLASLILFAGVRVSAFGVSVIVCVSVVVALTRVEAELDVHAVAVRPYRRPTGGPEVGQGSRSPESGTAREWLPLQASFSSSSGFGMTSPMTVITASSA